MNDKSRERRDGDFICRGGYMRAAQRKIAKDKTEESFVSVFLIARFYVRLQSAVPRLLSFLVPRPFLKAIDPNKVQSRDRRHERQGTGENIEESPSGCRLSNDIDHLVLRQASADCISDLDKSSLKERFRR